MKKVRDLVQAAVRAKVLNDASAVTAIDERVFGHVRYTLELVSRSTDGIHECVLFIGEEKTRGSGGGRHWAIPVPVKDPAHPAEVQAMARAIVRAASQSATRMDDRTWAGRWFDRLVGVQLINVVSVLDAAAGARRRRLSARITREPDGVLVTLVDEMDGFSPILARVPLDSFDLLQSRLDG